MAVFPPKSFLDNLAVRADGSHNRTRLSASLGDVRPVDDPTEPFVVGVVITPDDVSADQLGLRFVGGVPFRAGMGFAPEMADMDAMRGS